MLHTVSAILFLIALDDFQNPAHHQRVLDRTAIVVPAPADLRESPRAIQRACRAVRLANFQKRSSDTATTQLNQHRVEHLSRQTLAAMFWRDRDVQKLGVLSNSERDDVARDPIIRWICGCLKDSGMTGEDTTERFFRPRIGKAHPLDLNDLIEVLFSSRAQERGHVVSGRPCAASQRTCASARRP